MRTRSRGKTFEIWLNARPQRMIRHRRRAAKDRQERADPTALAPVIEEADMTDTRPTQDSNAGPDDDPQDQDSLQQQARRETSKAEGEDPDEDRVQTSTAPLITNPD